MLTNAKNLRTTRRGLLAGVGAGALAPLLSSCSGAGSGAEFHIVSAHATAESHFYHSTCLYFQEQIQERSDGRISMQVFSGGVFGGDRELTEAVQLNNIQMSLVSTSPIAAFEPTMNVFDLPFLFDSFDHVHKVLDGDYCQGLLTGLSDKYIKGLAYCENGFRNLTTGSTLVQSPDDMRGIKIRTLENPTQIRAWNATGASATPMAFTEVYTALQQGTVDAQENPFALIVSQRFYEVQDYAMLTQHVYSPAPLLMSQTFFDGLPEDLQDLVMEVSADTLAFNRAASQEDDARCQQIVIDDATQVVEIPEEGRNAFREVMLGAAEPYVRELIGNSSVDDFMTAVEEAR